MPSPYNYRIDDNKQGYTFTTDKGVEYVVYLYTDDSFAGRGWQFPVKQIVFGPRKERTKYERDDPRVMATICQIILQHIRYEEGLVLTWVCDTENERKNQHVRHRYFNQLFNAYQAELKDEGIEIHKEDRDFKSEHFDTEFMSVIVAKKHPFFADILTAFHGLDLSS